MGYFEECCHLCGVSFAVARHLRADERPPQLTALQEGDDGSLEAHSIDALSLHQHA